MLRFAEFARRNSQTLIGGDEGNSALEGQGEIDAIVDRVLQVQGEFQCFSHQIVGWDNRDGGLLQEIQIVEGVSAREIANAHLLPQNVGALDGKQIRGVQLTCRKRAGDIGISLVYDPLNANTGVDDSRLDQRSSRI